MATGFSLHGIGCQAVIVSRHEIIAKDKTLSSCRTKNRRFDWEIRNDDHRSHWLDAMDR